MSLLGSPLRPALVYGFLTLPIQQTYGNQTENFRWKGSSGWILSPPAYQKPEIKIKDEEVENEEEYKGATKIKQVLKIVVK